MLYQGGYMLYQGGCMFFIKQNYQEFTVRSYLKK